MKEALLYKKLSDGSIQCELCHQACLIKTGGRGICGVRENDDGTLYSRTFGKIISLAIDPIEKKPLFHFLPGTKTFSIAMAGCNFRCAFCQNADISQLTKIEAVESFGEQMSPEQVVLQATENECPSISYTYTEPTVFFEFALETAKIAHEKGLKNIFVTNGYMTEKALRMIRPYLDAANVDLKDWDESYYRRVCGAHVQPVKNNIKLMRKMGIWVEVTTLIIPKENDTNEEFRKIAYFLAKIGSDLPWHLSRFHPAYQMEDHEITPEETLKRAYDIGRKAGLNYVYLGNIPNSPYENTLCPKCSSITIERHGYEVKNLLKKGNKCPNCGKKIRVITN